MPGSDYGPRNISAGFESWRRADRLSPAVGVVSRRCVRTVRQWRGCRLQRLSPSRSMPSPSKRPSRTTHCDSEVEALFRIVMQCQIIDDVLDYAEDVSAGLPSFLTATASLPKAIELTAETARSYASKSHRATRNSVFPLRAAASVVTAAARLVVSLADLRHRTASPFSHWRVLRHPLTRCSPIAEDFSGSTEHPAAALRLDPDLLMDLQTSDSRSLRRTTRGPA